MEGAREEEGGKAHMSTYPDRVATSEWSVCLFPHNLSLSCFPQSVDTQS